MICNPSPWQVFLKNMEDFATVNGIYAKFFGSHKPARSAVEVARLPKDVLFEIECIARCATPLIIVTRSDLVFSLGENKL